jgi:hypothetical protein
MTAPTPIVLDTEAARKKAAEKPVINWDKVSLGLLQPMGKYRIKPQRLRILSQLFGENRLPDKHVEELLELSATDWESEAQADTCKLFAQCVVSLPRDWFVDAAPKQLDFADEKTYMYLKTRKMTELSVFIQSGEDSAGN